MRHVCLWVLCALGIVLIGCGSGNGNSNNVGGNWSASLTDSKDNNVLAFSALLTQGSSYQISVTNLSFTLASTCFGAGTTASSTFGSTGPKSGVAANAFQLTMLSSQSNQNGVNQVALTGTLSGNAISGTWAMTGSGEGCSDSGSFNMSRN